MTRASRRKVVAEEVSLARPPSTDRRQRKKRILGETAPTFDLSCDHHAVGRPGTKPTTTPDNEYERERAALILKNKEMLASLQVDTARENLAEAAVKRPKSDSRSRLRQHNGQKLGVRRRAAPVTRKSRRLLLRSAGNGGKQRGEDEAEEEENVTAGRGSQAEEGPNEHAGLMEQNAYLKMMGIKVKGVVTDGHFKGWVNPEVCKEFGIAASAQAAWEQNGGGKFSFKIDKKSLPAALLSKGWSTARAHSFTMLKKNPNTYFYRNVRPGEVHAQGEWTEEEHRAFVDTARRFGVGDKWGLFASYIPQRVGYQCSSYYRDVIIPSGLVLDARFKINGRGKAVFVG